MIIMMMINTKNCIHDEHKQKSGYLNSFQNIPITLAKKSKAEKEK